MFYAFLILQRRSAGPINAKGKQKHIHLDDHKKQEQSISLEMNGLLQSWKRNKSGSLMVYSCIRARFIKAIRPLSARQGNTASLQRCTDVDQSLITLKQSFLCVVEVCSPPL